MIDGGATRQTALREIRKAFQAGPIRRRGSRGAGASPGGSGDRRDRTRVTAVPNRSPPKKRQGSNSWTARRLAHEPVARILGEREFWGLPFVLSADTLVPRPDTETIVATALDLVPDRNAALRIVDLGHGFGLPSRLPAA